MSARYLLAPQSDRGEREAGPAVSLRSLNERARTFSIGQRPAFSAAVYVARHDRIVSLVTQMLDLHVRLAAEDVPHEKASLQRRMDQTDKQIDRLVYELYGLTEDEIKVVGAS